MSAKYEILTGDCREMLSLIPDEGIHCVVTSPPYFGLRDYGVEGQIGLESTLQEYVQNLVEVFRGIRRVLHPQGTLWLNLGDAYSHGGSGARDTARWPKQSRNDHMPQHAKKNTGLKPKDLLMVPHRVAIALQEDGWYVRSDVVWAKPNPMPESVTDRPTRSHEYIFQLTKNESYFYDSTAVREPSVRTTSGNKQRLVATQGERSRIGNHLGSSAPWVGDFRNLRDVWTVASKPYPDAHFATFPPELIQPCILASTSERGCCVTCNAFVERVIKRTRLRDGEEGHELPAMRNTDRGEPSGAQGVGHWRISTKVETIGWRPTCECRAMVEPCTVLDPFNGAGTTGLVATQLGRQYIGIELNPAFVEMSESRIRRTA